jgi:hypothetical protein
MFANIASQKRTFREEQSSASSEFNREYARTMYAEYASREKSKKK